MLSVFFIKRPIFAMVISLLIVLAGLVSIVILPIQEYPDVNPPTVVVSATYVGANAYTVEETVTRPLEDKINGQSTENRLLNVTEVAELLRISRFSVYNLVKRKELSAIKVLNKLRFDITSVEQYLEKQRINIEEK